MEKVFLQNTRKHKYWVQQINWRFNFVLLVQSKFLADPAKHGAALQTTSSLIDEQAKGIWADLWI